MAMRHIAVFLIDESTMRILFTEGAMLRCMAGMPSDAIILGIHANWAHRTFEIMVEHSSFPMFDLGCEPERRHVAWEIVERPRTEMHHAYPRYIGTLYNNMVVTDEEGGVVTRWQTP